MPSTTHEIRAPATDSYIIVITNVIELVANMFFFFLHLIMTGNKSN